jgi:hypothetical protein
MIAAPKAPIADRATSHRSTGSTANTIGDTIAAPTVKKTVSSPRRICPCQIPTNANNAVAPDANIIGVKAAALAANEMIDSARAMFDKMVIDFLPENSRESVDSATVCLESQAASQYHIR